jgi:hypothetical protein
LILARVIGKEVPWAKGWVRVYPGIMARPHQRVRLAARKERVEANCTATVV